MNTTKDATAPRSLTTGLNSAQVRLLAALAVTVGVWSLCLIGMSVMRTELEAGIARTQLATVQQLADQLDRKLRDRLDGLTGAASHLDGERIGDAAYVRDFLEARFILQQSFASGTAVVGLDGYNIADYPVVPERKAIYYGDREHFRETLATGRPFISKPAMGRVSKRPVIFMSAPVFGRGGDLKAVMVGMIDLTSPNFLGLFGETGHIGAAEVYLMSLGDNLFIVAPDSRRILTALPAPGVSAIADRLRAGFQGSMVAISSEGTEKLFSVQKVPTTGWLLELATPTEIIFTPVKRMQIIVVLSGLAVTVLALMLFQYVWSRFFVPLRALTQKLDAMTSGNQSQRRLPEAGSAEVHRLGASFNRLFARIETQEALIASVVDSTSHLIWSVDAVTYGLLTFNAALRDYFESNYGLHLTKGMRPEDMLSPEIARTWLGFYQRALREGNYSVEYRAQLGDLVLRLNFNLLYLDGEVFGISVFGEDITARNRDAAELARHRDHLEAMVESRTADLQRAVAESVRLLASLRKSEALYRGIGESIAYGVWVCDADGRNTYASESFLKMVGLTQQQCSDFGWGEVLHPDEVAGTIAAWQECVKSGGSWNREHRFRGVDGLWHHVLARGVPVRDANGQVMCWAGINLDITELKQTEEDLRIAKEIAERANAAKSRFLAAASHDLRQPLSALALYTRVLFDKVAPSERQIVARMKECIVGLSCLLNDLLDLSKLSAGVVTVKCEDFPIARLLDNLRSAHGPVAEAKGLRLRCVASRLIGRTDPVLLQRIVGNFIENALRYTERGGVVVGCRRREGRVFVEVWDTGVGIPADKRTEIFEEFRQLGDEARNSGSGLGLAIAAKAAALLGLEIQVRSTLRRGSVFAIEIPAGEAHAVQVLPLRAAACRSLRIALVEDNRLVREALETAMQEAGHQLFSAAGGDELLALLGSIAPDAVVSDYRLGNGRTGFEVISALRSKFSRDIPAIIISGDTDPALLRSMAERGIIVLHKPLDFEELQACIHAMTSPAAATNI